MPRLSWPLLVCFGLIVAGVALLPAPAASKPMVTVVTEFKQELVAANPVPVFQPLLGQMSHETATFANTLSAQSVYVMDVPSATILLEKQSNLRRSMASTTKLITALVALDMYAPNQVLTVNDESLTEGMLMGLETGENITVKDVLAGLLVQSGNDAALVLANNHPQGLQGFISAMNLKSSQLGLKNTAFSNPTGLDASNHYSTARDLAIVSREVMQQPVLLGLVQTKDVIVSDTTLALQHRLINTNALLGLEPGVIGIKTGTTEQAGEVLTLQLVRDSREIVIVVMGSQDRYKDTRQIIDWVFDHYLWKEVVSGTLN